MFLLPLAGNRTQASRVAGENSTTEPPERRLVIYQFCLHWRVLFSVYFHMQFSLQLSLWGFTGSIPPKFVLKLYSSRPLPKIWKNYKDEMKWRHYLFGNWKTVFEYPPLEKFMHFVLICICIPFWFSVTSSSIHHRSISLLTVLLYHFGYILPRILGPKIRFPELPLTQRTLGLNIG